MASPHPDAEMKEPATATEPEADQEVVPQVLFRAGKKRKAYRQRDHAATTKDDGNGLAVQDHQSDRATSEQLLSPVDLHHQASTRQTTVSPATEEFSRRMLRDDPGSYDEDSDRRKDEEEDDGQESGVSVAEALRLRNARRAAARLRGVEFRPDSAGGLATGLSPLSGEDDGGGGGMTLAVPTTDDEAMKSPLFGAGVDGAGAGAVGSPPPTAGAPPILGLSKQFAHQTGMVSQVVNRHM